MDGMVGALGFEPGASCAQDRLTISCKSRIFKHSIENTNLSFVRGMWWMWRDVSG